MLAHAQMPLDGDCADVADKHLLVPSGVAGVAPMDSHVPEVAQGTDKRLLEWMECFNQLQCAGSCLGHR